MSLQRLLGQTAALFRAATTADGFGDARARWPNDWAATSAQTVKCRLQQASGYESTDNRNVAVGQWRLFLPADAIVSERDRVRVDGRYFEIVTVYPVHQPSGLHHYECDLNTYSGEVPRGD